MEGFIELFPTRDNVGTNKVTPTRVKAGLAKTLVRSGLWAYTPKPSSPNDVQLMVKKAQAEIQEEARELKEERERLIREREELEAIREQLLTGQGKAGRPKKAEV